MEPVEEFAESEHVHGSGWGHVGATIKQRKTLARMGHIQFRFNTVFLFLPA